MIELLVVIAVFMVILSMLQPSLKAMKGVAEQVTCQNNLKGIGVAYALYPEDHSGWLVRGGNMFWAWELKEYLGLEFPGNVNQYRSFDAKGTILECPNVDYGDGTTPPLFGGYGFNTAYLGAFPVSYSRLQLRRQKRLDVVAPAETLVIGDGMNFFPNNPRYHLMYQPSSIPWHSKAGYGDFVYTRHNEGLNVMWVDGHVSFHNWEIFKQGRGNDLNYYYRLKK